ncbi:hypothetical protein [Isoptericola sp. NPDC057391]|uniref:hypothetical protein n=1 Tax=Isoptericola sp. NPDC057391 TaxID=3346117 RepID=UPI0036427B77
MIDSVHICIGAPSAGVDRLHAALERQPRVFVPPIREVRFWHDGRTAEEAQRAEDDAWQRPLKEDQKAWLERWRPISAGTRTAPESYLSLMRTPGRPSVDFSPTYALAGRSLAETMHKFLPADSKIVYLVAEPIERATADLRHRFHHIGGFRGRAAPGTVETWLDRPDLRAAADYANIIRDWSDAFGPRFRWFDATPTARGDHDLVQEVADFLGFQLENLPGAEPSITSPQDLAPSYTARERAAVARAVRSHAEAFSQIAPTTSADWLRTVTEAEAAAPAEPAVRDTTPRVDALMRMTESLGDNCEYGFWQRHRAYEPSSLFRWAITPIESLAEFLANPTSLYALEDLTPHSPGMVADRRSGFKFHSKLVERTNAGKLTLLHDAEERDRVHREEKSKIDFLHRRFLDQLEHQPAVYLVKCNTGINGEHVLRVRDLLRAYNPEHWLLWVGTGEQAGVSEIEDNLLYAELERFARYVQADDYVEGGWTRLMYDLAEVPGVAKLIDRMAP